MNVAALEAVEEFEDARAAGAGSPGGGEEPAYTSPTCFESTALHCGSRRAHIPLRPRTCHSEWDLGRGLQGESPPHMWEGASRRPGWVPTDATATAAVSTGLTCPALVPRAGVRKCQSTLPSALAGPTLWSLRRSRASMFPWSGRATCSPGSMQKWSRGTRRSPQGIRVMGGGLSCSLPTAA